MGVGAAVLIVGFLAWLILMGWLLIRWAHSRAWKVPFLWRLLPWDFAHWRWLVKTDARVDTALAAVRDRIDVAGLEMPPIEACVLKARGIESDPQPLIYGFVFEAHERKSAESTALFLVIPDFQLEEYTDDDLRILIAHKCSQLASHLYDWRGNPFLENVKKAAPRDPIMGMVALLYGPERTGATLTKLGAIW